MWGPNSVPPLCRKPLGQVFFCIISAHNKGTHSCHAGTFVIRAVVTEFLPKTARSYTSWYFVYLFIIYSYIFLFYIIIYYSYCNNNIIIYNNIIYYCYDNNNICYLYYYLFITFCLFHLYSRKLTKVLRQTSFAILDKNIFLIKYPLKYVLVN